jgi:hypothetical protein
MRGIIANFLLLECIENRLLFRMLSQSYMPDGTVSSPGTDSLFFASACKIWATNCCINWFDLALQWNDFRPYKELNYELRIAGYYLINNSFITGFVLNSVKTVSSGDINLSSDNFTYLNSLLELLEIVFKHFDASRLSVGTFTARDWRHLNQLLSPVRIPNRPSLCS